MNPAQHRPLQPLLAWSGVLLGIVGFLANRMWRFLPLERFAESLVFPVLALLVAWPLRRWAGWSWASGIATAWLLALAATAGMLAVPAILLLGAATCALGLWLLPAMPGRVALATVAGLLLVAGAGGWSLQLPLHHAAAWYALLSLVVALRWRALREAGSGARAAWRAEVAAAPRWAAFATMLLGLASVTCWLPSLQADDVVYHLRLPSQLLAEARYRPLPEFQAWALAPWAGDTLHGIVAVLARAHERGMLDALWLALGAAASWAFAHSLGGDARARWASVALFASTPLLAALAGGMHTELPATAALLSLATLAIAPGARSALPIAVLAGGLLALKLVHLLSALPLLALAAMRRPGAWAWPRWPVALLAFALVGGSAYAQAWWLAGNPVLPLFNDVFGSPYFAPVAFDDPRWHAGFNALLPWRLVFDTPRYLEDGEAALGFALVALAGVWVVALLRRELRAVAVAAALGLALTLLPLQYARYAFPALAVLLPVLVVATAATLRPRGFTLLLAGLCMLNFAFQSNAHWLLRTEMTKRFVKSGGSDYELQRRYMPELAVLGRLPEGDAGIVLATDPARPNVAILGSRGRSVSWYSPSLQARAAAAARDGSGEAWRALFCDTGARWLLATQGRTDPALQAAMDGAGARLHARVADAELWALPGRCRP